MSFAHGRLHSPDVAPRTGEQIHRLAEMGPVVVDQILSGRLDGPVDYRQDIDEWVVVLEGSATLDVEGRRMDIGTGDWILLPAGTAHTLVETRPGTSWLTVTTPASTATDSVTTG